MHDTLFTIITNTNGPAIGYSPQSGVSILTVDGLHFKDLNKSGKLEPFKDWRLDAETRARDLASRLSIKQIAGLMLYSSHQAVPSAEISREQRNFLHDDNVRHLLITQVKDAETAARWSNNVQAFVEGLGMGIPANNSSDPRNKAAANAEFDAGAGGHISIWPDGLAMAATFEPELVKEFAEIASREYRALGITTALSPQADLGTEPRWYRVHMTFGEHPQLVADMTRAYIDGFQTSNGIDEISGGWGYASVNAMVKHWPGGGTGEGGRDAHWAYGKFAVYPGNNFAMHLFPFTGAAFKLSGPTSKASAIMPYYTVSWGCDPSGENVGNSYSRYIITDLLRTKYDYNGVICTDWIITHDEGARPDIVKGKPWGVERLSAAGRHYRALMAGVDQFGGNNDVRPVLEAYAMGVQEHGEQFMRARFERSATRLLLNIFRLGLFENPYVDPRESARLVGNAEFMNAGYKALLKSIILLKNRNGVLPLPRRKTVYLPRIYYPAVKDIWSGKLSEPRYDYPLDTRLLQKYYTVTDDPAGADFALVVVTSPYSADGGYSADEREETGNGYIPITLQYLPYTARCARQESIAAGDPVTDPGITNRSYNNKTVTAANTTDLQTILDTRAVMQNKPVIVVVRALKPMVVREFEACIDGLIYNFGVPDQAVLDIISGSAEPFGLLPMQMPADMDTVERHCEDVPFDIECHTDSEGSVYDFGFGLNWRGVISDDRTRRYSGKSVMGRQ